MSTMISNTDPTFPFSKSMIADALTVAVAVGIAFHDTRVAQGATLEQARLEWDQIAAAESFASGKPEEPDGHADQVLLRSGATRAQADEVLESIRAAIKSPKRVTAATLHRLWPDIPPSKRRAILSCAREPERSERARRLAERAAKV